MLSDSDISWELTYGNLEIEPVDLNEQLGPCSLDIRLGDAIAELDLPPGEVLDVREDNIEEYAEERKIGEDGFLVEPDGFYLANTVESISIPDYLGVELKGRSSIGRLGIQIHMTAGLFDAGFFGEDGVLEISSSLEDGSVRLYPGMRVGQLVFYSLESPANTPYGEKDDSKYQGQSGAVGSRIGGDFE